MQSILKLESVAFIGESTPDTTRLSSELAEIYNESYNLENISSKRKLGFEFLFNEEVKSLKKEYCQIDDVLKIHLNENTHFIMPGLFTSQNAYDKYYNKDVKVKEKKSLKEALNIGINRGRILEQQIFDKDKDMSLINEFSFLFENEQLDEISIQGIKDTAAKLVPQSVKDKYKNYSDERKKKREGIPDDQFAKISKSLKLLVDEQEKARKSKLKPEDKEREDDSDKDIPFTKHLKPYLNTAGLVAENIHYKNIEKAIVKFYSEGGDKSAAELAINEMLSQLTSSIYFGQAKDELTSFIKKHTEREGVFGGTNFNINSKKIEDKIQEIYTELANASSNKNIRTDSDVAKDPERVASQSFRGSFNPKMINKVNKELKKKASFWQKGIIKYFVNVAGSFWKLYTLIMKNKMKTLTVSTLLEGFHGIFGWLLTTLAQAANGFVNIVVRLLSYAILKATGDDTSGLIDVNALQEKILDLGDVFTSLLVQFITNPVNALKDNIMKFFTSIGDMNEVLYNAKWISDDTHVWLADIVKDMTDVKAENWVAPNTVYLMMLGTIVLIYSVRNVGAIIVHVKQLGGAIINIIGTILKPITGDRIKKFSAGLFDDINFQDHIKNNTVDDFVTKAISGVDGIDGKMGQSMALLGLKCAINVMKDEGDLFTKIGDGDNAKEADLDAFDEVINAYLKEYNESYKTLAETSASVKSALKIEIKNTAAEVMSSSSS